MTEIRGCKVRTWRDCTCIIFTKRSRPSWDEFAGNDADAFYAYGYFFFRNMKTFKNKAVRNHEWAHKEQSDRDGSVWFSLKYAFYNLVHGYENNPYEVEARSRE